MKKYDSVRVFKNPVLESLTHVHPIIPLLVWTPVAIFLLSRHELSAFQWILWVLIGLISWTITEYTLHRWVFHYEATSKLGKRLVYLFHGLHHDDPNDPTRLVFPPLPAAAIFCVLYLIFSSIVPAPYVNVFCGSFVVGYLIYDYIHYATHHFPMTSPIGKMLRTHHLKHHFSKEHSKYGVSSPLWDVILGTLTGPKKD